MEQVTCTRVKESYFLDELVYHQASKCGSTGSICNSKVQRSVKFAVIYHNIAGLQATSGYVDVGMVPHMYHYKSLYFTWHVILLTRWDLHPFWWYKIANVCIYDQAFLDLSHYISGVETAGYLIAEIGPFL